jgi:uncharacterized SAM-binding protein YcdF (DUF218 family)
MMFLIKKLVASLAMPLPVAFLLVGLAILALKSYRRRLASFLATASVALVFLASWAPVADGLLRPLERMYPGADVSSLSAGPMADAIVVLGGGYIPEPGLPVTAQLNETTLARLAEALRLHHALPELPLVLSGGSVRGRAPSAHGYLAAARSLGVLPAELHVLDTPRDTGEEAAKVLELLGEGARVLLVTSASHMPRAVRLFSSAGLDVLPAPTGHLAVQPEDRDWEYWIPSAVNLRKTERAIYEYLGGVAATWRL